MKKIKEWLKVRLARALAPEIDQQLSLNQRLEEVTLYGMAPWYQENLWEPPVQLALRDLCRPGDVAFDVGANFGGLTTVMSRRVGPKGVVCAFEASPRIVGKCQRNLVLNGCNNVQLYHAAVYHKSHTKVPIYLGNHLNDSIYSSQQGESAAYEVQTLALDDFVEQVGLTPNLVKMDIEGAEFDAVQGMLKTIARAKPHLILETQPEDSRCLHLLREHGYVAIDLNTYREVVTAADYPEGAGIRNNLYIHQDRRPEVPYNPPFKFVEAASLAGEDFLRQEDGSACLKTPLILDRGRYLIDVNFTAEGAENELTCGVKAGDRVIFRYHAYSRLLAASYRDWVIHLPETSNVNLYFEFLNGTRDETLSVRGAKIVQIADFYHLPAELYQ